MKRLALSCIFFLCGVLAFSGFARAEDGLEFPLRPEFPGLAYIESDELAKIFDGAIIVDTRNEMEYNVIHIKGAHILLVGKMKEEELTALRAKDGAAPLVFYCNGTTCPKSYKAAEKANKWGFKNVFVYDSGIFQWAKKYPSKAEFFGKTMTDDDLAAIEKSREELKNHSLATADFIAKVDSGEYTVIDVRDPNERSEQALRLPKMKILPVDTMIDLLTKGNAAVPKSKLLIIDNVGKQIGWIKYYFDNQGVTDYYFVKGGVLQWKKDGFDETGKK